MMELAQFSISEDHPSLKAHFPGNPMVPGALLLDEILRHIGGVQSIISAKFLNPVLPNQICCIEEIERSDTRLKLEISVSGVVVMKMIAALS